MAAGEKRQKSVSKKWQLIIEKWRNIRKKK